MKSILVYTYGDPS